MAPKPIDIGKIKNGKTQFIDALNSVYEKELKAKIKELGERMPDGSKTVLSEKEISRLRNHPDLGLWNKNNLPLSVENVNAHFRWYNKNKSIPSNKPSPLRLKGITPKQIEGFTREYLESQESLTREAESWINRLDGKDWWNPRKKVVGPNGKVTLGGIEKGTGKKLWPPGLNRKNILNHIGASAKETGEYNAKLFKELGFKFQKGHGWGVMGPLDKRTWVIPHYGARMEGHFSFRNVAPQPQSPTLKQLLNPFWNAIIPNVPSKHSKYGVQIESAEDLRWAGGGGQGWSGTIADNLLSKIPNANIDDFDKLPLDQKAYILFADPDKGGGATPESRYFEIKNGQWEHIKRRIAPFAATSEAQSPPARKIVKGSSEWWNLQKTLGTGVIGTTALNLVNQAAGMAKAMTPDVHDVLNPKHGENIGDIQRRIKEGENPLTVLKEEGKESLGVLTEDLKTNAAYVAAFSLLGKNQLFRKGASSILPGVAPVVLAKTAYDFGDKYLEASTGKGLTDRQAEFWKQDKVVDSVTGDVTYEDSQEVKESKAKVFDPLREKSKEKFPNQAHTPGDWYEKDGNFYIYQDFGKFTKSRNKGSGSEVPASSYL